MMWSKSFRVALVGALAVAGASAAGPLRAAPADDQKGTTMPASFYAFTTTRLTGEPADLKEYAGKVALVVNTASKCGFTPQYKGLQQLYTDLNPKGFVILGFPSNDFGGQEPGTAEEIKQFCELNYKVTFPMFSKVVTKAGPDQSPIYSWLGQTGNLPKWNFSKYLIGRDGKVLAFFPSNITPESPELRKAIEQALQ
jgi:glutathione peroxidase